ncbi:hypothetical protein HZB07_05550 [Candidatus Saganbacteria bacterium]|nr:hypothetical protein [Candidatus Saganbacteria bacterium]
MKFIKLLVVVMLVIGAVMIGGCGGRTESASYFYAPGWTRGGAIIYISSSFGQYVKTIYPSGTGESSVLFDVTNNIPYAMTCSPTGEYVAFGNDLRNGLFRRIVIRNISTGTRNGLDAIELAFNPGIKVFDWSSDGAKLVYCTSTEVRTINTNGSGDTLVVAATNLEFVSWRFGGRIAFVRTVSSEPNLSLIYPDGSGRIDLAAAVSVDFPQISSANTNEVYGLNGGSLAKITSIDVTAMRTTLLADSNAELPRLSPDAKYLTYNRSTESSGIYVVDVTAASPIPTKIK